jgi:hypothetical protein
MVAKTRERSTFLVTLNTEVQMISEKFENSVSSTDPSESRLEASDKTNLEKLLKKLDGLVKLENELIRKMETYTMIESVIKGFRV